MKQLSFFAPAPKFWKSKLYGAEVKVMRLNDALPEETPCLDNPEAFHRWFVPKLESSMLYNPDVENLCVTYLNTRRRAISWSIVSQGTLDTLLVHAREVFRAGIVLNASALLLAHNHPSNDSTPSESDIKVTRDLVRAGQLLKIDLLDHVILGRPSQSNPKGYSSLRELGYFY